MFGLNTSEILFILLAALLLFGTKKLPEVGASLGRSIREFKRALSGTDDSPSGKDRTVDVSPGADVKRSPEDDENR